MNEIRLIRRGRVRQRLLQITAASLAIAGTGAVSGCLTRPVQPNDTRTTSTVVTRLPESSVDKIDLLLMIDNSRSMADKQHHICKEPAQNKQCEREPLARGEDASGSRGRNRRVAVCGEKAANGRSRRNARDRHGGERGRDLETGEQPEKLRPFAALARLK